MRGHFISVEGGEGSGKSTQLKLLTAAFEKSGLPFVATREPGGVPSAERIRAMLVSGDGDAWGHLGETLLFQAARAEHIEKLINPALAAGKTIICDRFLDSTIVYQGIAKGLGAEYIKNMHHLFFGNFMPDLTIILDIEPEKGLARAGSRNDGENRFEGLDIEFHQRIRHGFLDIAKCEPQRCVVLDAGQDVAKLHAQIIVVVREHLGVSFA